MRHRTWIIVLTLVAGAWTLTACGSDESDEKTRKTTGNATDAAFVIAMIPHEEATLAMAELAQQRAEHKRLRAVADEIVEAQKREIPTMKAVKGRLRTTPSAERVGRDYAERADATIRRLRDAKEFDREFIEIMLPHQGEAVAMAEEEIRRGTNRTLGLLAFRSMSLQEQEIAALRRWRKAWFGAGGG